MRTILSVSASSRSVVRPVAQRSVTRVSAKPVPRSLVKVNFFSKFRQNSQSAGIYGSQGRDDYTADDVEHYFNYMGMLATEGSYDRMEAMMKTGLHPVDCILLMACTEGDTPKVQELLAAGANVSVKDEQGRTPLDLCSKPDIKTMLEAALAKK